MWCRGTEIEIFGLINSLSLDLFSKTSCIVTDLIAVSTDQICLVIAEFENHYTRVWLAHCIVKTSSP